MAHAASAAAPLSPRLGHAERDYAYSIALRIVKDRDAADDVAQDALLLAHRHRDAFRGDARYSTWLYRITTTAALMYLRRARRRARGRAVLDPADEARAAAAEPRDPAPGPHELAVAREELAQVGAAATALAPSYREVVRLRFGLGMSDGEVARALGIGLSTAKTRALRARRALRATRASKAVGCGSSPA